MRQRPFWVKTSSTWDAQIDSIYPDSSFVGSLIMIPQASRAGALQFFSGGRAVTESPTLTIQDFNAALTHIYTTWSIMNTYQNSITNAWYVHIQPTLILSEYINTFGDRLICVNAGFPPDVPCESRSFWSHAAQLPVAEDWNCVVAVSDHHATLLRARLPGARVVALPAGASRSEGGAAAPDRFLYGSSPDRGLHRLLRMWPSLWSRFRRPLSITYDVRAVLRRRGGAPDPIGARLRAIASLLDQPGVIVHGALDEAQLAGLRARSLACLYPLDPVLPESELYALAVLDAAAAGVPLVLSPTDCFPSEYAGAARFVEGFEAEAWGDAIAEVLADRPRWAERGERHAARRSHESWVAGWLRLIESPGPSRAWLHSSPVEAARSGPCAALVIAFRASVGIPLDLPPQWRPRRGDLRVVPGLAEFDAQQFEAAAPTAWGGREGAIAVVVLERTT